MHKFNLTCDGRWLIPLTHGSEVERTRSTFSFTQLEAEEAAGMKSIILINEAGLAICIISNNDEDKPQAATVRHQQQRYSSQSIESHPSAPRQEWDVLARDR
jgi:hypothetical protein